MGGLYNSMVLILVGLNNGFKYISKVKCWDANGIVNGRVDFILGGLNTRLVILVNNPLCQ